jgi:signal peptidase I
MVVFRALFLDWNIVPTASMKPTIVEGDYILVNKLAYDVRVPLLGWRLMESSHPKRGDIIIFQPPGSSDRYVKRVLGLPDEKIEMRDQRLYVNGDPAGFDFPDLGPSFAELEGPFLAPVAHAIPVGHTHSAPARLRPVEVPKDHFFVLGDNRCNSKDSRSFGFVPRDRVLGRVVCVLISVDMQRSWWPRFDRFLHPLA